MGDNQYPPQPSPIREGRNAASPFTLHFSLKQRAAFTLAEVLIILGVIGVVAALTMPSVIANIRNAKLESQFKHSYSILNNALETIKYKNNIDNLYTYYVDAENLDSTENTRFSNDFEKAFKNIQKCYSYSGYVSANEICKDIVNNYDSSNDYYLSFDGKSKVRFHYNFFDLYYLPSGAIIYADASPTYSLCIYIDVNGPSLPNRLGYDFFPFHISEKGTLEAGGYKLGLSSVNSIEIQDIVNHAISNTCYEGSGKSYFQCLR